MIFFLKSASMMLAAQQPEQPHFDMMHGGWFACFIYSPSMFLLSKKLKIERKLHAQLSLSK